MMRIGLNLGIASSWDVWLISGAPEKGIKKNLEQLYPEPAQVPLGEKPKV